MRGRRLAAGAFSAYLLAAGALSPLAPPASAAELQKLRVSMGAQIAIYAPFLIPIDKGYYAEGGLESVITIATGGVSVPAQIAGQIDINTSGNVALTPILRGSPMKLVYCEAAHPIYQLWSQSPDVKSLKDLKGQQVGIFTRGDSLEIGTKMALMKAGLPLDWVSYTALGGYSMAPFAIGGTLAAYVLPNTDVDVVRKAGALKGNLLVDMNRDIFMPFDCISVTDEFLRTQADALRRFLLATMKAVKYEKKYPQQTIDIIQKYTKQPNREITKKDYDDTIPIVSDDGLVPTEALQQDLDLRGTILGLPKDQVLPVDKVYDFSILREVNAELENSHWVPQP